MMNPVHAEERADEETGAEVAATEARARVVVRAATRTSMWLILFALILYYSIEGVIWVFKALTGVLLMIVLAVFFAYLIAPLVELVRGPFEVRGQERRLPRYAAIAVVYVAIFGSLALTTWLLLPRIGDQLAEFASQAPIYLTSARVRAESLNQIYERLSLPPVVRSKANEMVSGAITEAGKYVTSEGGSGAIHFLSYLPWLFLVPILAFFFLKDAESFRRSALSILPQGRLRWRGDEFFQDVNSTLAAYIRAQLIACLLIGCICTLGFWALGVPYWLPLGVLAGVLEFIPLLGPLVVAVVAFSLSSFASGGTALGVLLFLGVLRVVHDYYTYPRIIGSGIHLHPLAVILAILAGHELAGLAGIFLAIPVIAILTVTYRHWLEHKGSQGLVADLLKPAEEAAEQDALAGAGARALGGDAAGAPTADAGQARVGPTAPAPTAQ